MTVAEELAARILGFGRDGPSEPALAMARRCIADTVGVALAGSGEECARLLLATPGVAEAPGKSLLIGTRRRPARSTPPW